MQTLMQRLPPLRYVVGSSFDLRVGQTLDLDAEKRRLEAAGYRNVPQVLDPGDFAVRGGLLDVYPMGADAPYRIELLDDEIDSIRAFDPETQRSLEKVEAVQLLPGARCRWTTLRCSARWTRCASASTSTPAAARCTRT